jgi:hypothetical protein
VSFNSLIWFAVVVVAGITSIAGALLGAFLFTLLGLVLGEAGISVLLIGLLALFLGRMPGGLVGVLSRIGSARVALPASLLEAYRAEQEAGPPAANGELRPSPAARELLARARSGGRS